MGRGRGGRPSNWSRQVGERDQPLTPASAPAIPFSATGRGRNIGGWQRGWSARTDRGAFANPRMTQSPNPEPPLGTLLHSLNDSDLNDDAKGYISESVITDCMAVASYNWLDREEPTVVIPGSSYKALEARTGLTKH